MSKQDKPNDSETIILSGALADPELARGAIDRGLESKDFVDESAGRIWQMFIDADNLGEVLNSSAMTALAKRAHVETTAEIITRGAARWPGSRDLHDKTLSAFLFESRKRRSVAAARRGVSDVLEADDEEKIEKAARRLRQSGDIAMEVRRQPILTSRQVARNVTTTIEEPPLRLQTGIEKLDNVLGGGLDMKRVVSLIGKYKIGKTTLLSTIGYNVACGTGEKDPENRAKVLFITLERNQIDVEMMNMARALGTNMAKLEGRYDRYEKEIEDYISDPVRDSILYYHRPGAGLEEISSVMTRAVRQHGVKLVMIDYYQVIGRPSGNSRLVDHLMNVDQTITRLANDLDIAVLIAAQSDADGAPRDSKSLLQSAAANFAIRRQDGSPEAWLDNLASNYRKQRDAGSPNNPAMILDEEAGPHFRSV